VIVASKEPSATPTNVENPHRIVHSRKEIEKRKSVSLLSESAIILSMDLEKEGIEQTTKNLADDCFNLINDLRQKRMGEDQKLRDRLRAKQQLRQHPTVQQ